MSKENKPSKFMLGNVALTKWVNENELITYSMEKSYKDNNDEWKTSKTFNRDELLKLRTLIDKVIQEEIKQF